MSLIGISTLSILSKADKRLRPGEVEKLKQQLRENITRAQAGVRLDLNLEKGRIRDELSARDLKLKEVDTRIESEVREAYRHERCLTQADRDRDPIVS